jgi:hypothetical protein
MAKILSLIYLGTLLFWIYITIQADHVGGLYLQILLFIVPFIGALVGFRNAKLWGGLESALGKAVAFISAGTLAWSIGMLFWNYYIFVAKIEIPYPSLADAAFILSWPLWAIGVFYLSKATGVRFALRQNKGKVLLVLVPLVAIALSYYLLVSVARGGVVELDVSNFWKLFFDLFYPIGSAVIFTMALTFFSLSSAFLGGKYRTPIILLIVALLVNFFADVTFSYTTTNGTYFNGHFVDLMFVTGMYLFALSLSLMVPRSDMTQTTAMGTSKITS